MKGYDAFKIVQGEETASACTVRVLKPLDCAHKVAMECSQWKQSPGAMQRVSKLRTVHPRNGMAGHSFFLRLCSSTTRLETVIKGHEDGIQKKLYAYNDGRPSRFNEVVFEDFDSQELEAARRKGFGNARAVRKLFEVKKLVRISDENYARELKGQETVPQKTKPYFGNAGAVEQ
ncbi:hypothetical protein PI124_g16671 [Phytophthora idaei]|nr:hypothetical protein PI124_g16671 [Phytophthora idaei]